MSKQVDERVVEMRFDNRQFESGVKDTMSTLDKFKQKLQLKDATKGLDDLEKAAKKVDLNPLGKAAESVSMKFSALQVAGVTALANITNSAVNAGKNIVKAFTLDPIIAGFQEYETQINSVQTILANTESKGSTLQDVNAALNELNKYADMTIYNFTEMTRNIGTFTAAGVDLKTSVSAIKGIANLAAVSGSTSLQASTAMYQLSQALAAGKVQLMDWNSVVNAGMGGQVFQDALKETARVHGVAIDDMIKQRGSFRETLQDGWLTAEVLTETLSKFTGDLSEQQLKQMGYTEEQIAGIIKMGKTANDAATKVKTFTQLFDTLKEAAQSGWTRTWEIFIGDFGEAKEFLTGISDALSDIINKSADARNSMLSGGLSSGWKQLLNAGIADEEGYKETLKSVVNEHGTSIDEMIKAEQKLDETLTDTEAFQKVLKKGLAEGTLTSDTFTESVHKMAEKMGNMSAEELEAAGYTKDHLVQIEALSAGLKDGSVSMDEFVKKMGRSSGRENLIEALWNSFNALLSIIKPIKEAFREVFPATTGEQIYSLTERIRDFTATLKLSDKQAANLKAAFKGIFSVISVGVTIIKSIISGITTLIGKITGLSGGLLEISGSMGDWVSKMADGINEANLFGKAIDGIVGFLGGAIDAFKEFTGAIREKVTANGFEWFFNLMQGIWDVIQRVSKAVGTVAVAIGKALGNAFSNGDFKSLLDILNGGIFATILLGIKKYITGITDKFDDSVGIVDKIKDVLGSVEDSLKSWQQNLQSGTIKNIAIAIGILAASLWVLSGIDSDKMGTALGGIGVLMTELMGAMWLFTKITADAKSALKGIPALVGIAAAIFILASALKKLSDLDWKQLGVGLTGIAGLMGIATGAMIALSTFTSKSDKIFKVSKDGIFSQKTKKNLISVGLAMIAMAAAVKILASACKDLSELSWSEIAKGLSGISGILLAFVGFQKLMEKVKTDSMMSSAFSLILIGAAMKVFASAAKDFSEISWEGLGKAGAAIAVILHLAAGFGILSKWSENMKSSAFALIIIGAAMEIFADVVGKFGAMEWPDLGKAGAALTAVLGLSVLFLKFAGKAKNMGDSVASLLFIGAAMEIFAHVVGIFGNMEWPDLGKAGLAITGILALVLGFSAIAGKIDGIMTSAAALLVVAAALLVLTPVIKTLGSMSIGQVAIALIALAGGLAIFIGAAALIDKFQLGPAMWSLAGAIALIGAACLAAGAGLMLFATGFTALAAAGTAGATAVVAALTILIVGILNLIPSIVDQLTAAIVAICNVIIQSAPAIGKALKELVLLAIDIMVECVPQLAEGILQLWVKVMELLVQYTPQILDLLVNFILAVINGLAARIPEYVAALANFITTLINSLAEHVPEFVAAGVNLYGAIIQGIADAVGPMLDIISDVFSKLLDSVAEVLPGIADIINSVGNVIENWFYGLSGVIESVGNAALNSGKGFKEMADGIKTITDLKIVDMAASLAAVALGIKKITKNSKGLDKAGKGMKQISDATKLSADSFNSIASGVSTVLSAFNGIGESAESAVTSMVNSFANAKGPMESSTSSIMTACINAIKNSEGKFSNSGKVVINKLVATLNNGVSKFTEAGKYLVDGFAKGITDNTFKAEAKAKAMADAALTAARAKLKVESPSKEFMKVGAFVVAGFAKGISKNIGDANKASVKMANGVLESTQDALGIHSPSVVFNKEVGRYIVQGIAEGIKGDMSAEEAAEKKAQNIVSAFQNELDKIDRGISNRSKDFDLWQLTDGETASDIATAEKQRKKLNDDLWDYNQQVKLTTDKYLTLKETFGENYKATQEAYGAMRDAQITAAQTASSLISIDKSIIASQEEHLDNWKTINENGLKILELESANGYVVSDAYKDSRYIDTYTDNLNIAKREMDNAEKAYSDAIAKYGDMNHSVVQEARKSYQEKWIKWLEEMQTLSDYEKSISDRELQNIEDNKSHREDIIARWEAKYGDDASDKQRYLFYKNMYDTDSVEAWKEYRVYLKKYEDFVKELAEKNNITIEEAKKLDVAVALYNNEVYPAETKAMEADKKVSDLRKDFLEQQKEDLKEEYETASDIADLKYQIWEKTTGRDATDTEKDTMKLAFLTEQLGQQAKLVKMAKEAWKNAKDDEKLKYEKEYYNAQLELANLQSEVLDIQEENIKRQERALDRQRLAQDDYNDYIKKYEKYYLEHGMTREELEKDAKLVSGYDPNKAINTAVSKTNNAIDTIKTNMSKITEAVGEGIQNGISTVTDSTTTMLDSCSDLLSAEKDTWFEAGSTLMNSLAEGIKSNAQIVVDSVTDLASRMVAAFQETLGSSMTSSGGSGGSTVSPVVNMDATESTSELSSGAPSWLSTSGRLASSIAKSSANKSSESKAGSSTTSTYSFTQNNYSPKSLSAVEVYRQTNNLISRLGKAVTS